MAKGGIKISVVEYCDRASGASHAVREARMTQRTIQKWEDYDRLIGGISKVLKTARRASARSVNAIMTAAYWEIGRRIVEFEQAGKPRADYGEELLKRLEILH